MEGGGRHCRDRSPRRSLAQATPVCWRHCLRIPKLLSGIPTWQKTMRGVAVDREFCPAGRKSQRQRGVSVLYSAIRNITRRQAHKCVLHRKIMRPSHLRTLQNASFDKTSKKPPEIHDFPCNTLRNRIFSARLRRFIPHLLDWILDKIPEIGASKSKNASFALGLMLRIEFSSDNRQ